LEDNEVSKASQAETEARRQGRHLRAALGFGVVMATIQMAILLYFLYC
jgi:hypothetical protein